MTEELYVLNGNIVANITTYYQAAVQANRHTQFGKFHITGFEFANSHEAEKSTLFNQVNVDTVTHQNIIPIVATITI